MHLCCCALALCDVHGMCRLVRRQAQAPMGLDVGRAASLHDVVFSVGERALCVPKLGRGRCVCANTGGAQALGRHVLPGVVIFVSDLHHPTLQHMFIGRPDTANRGTSQQPVGLGAQPRFLARRCAADDVASQAFRFSCCFLPGVCTGVVCRLPLLWRAQDVTAHVTCFQPWAGVLPAPLCVAVSTQHSHATSPACKPGLTRACMQQYFAHCGERGRAGLSLTVAQHGQAVWGQRYRGCSPHILCCSTQWHVVCRAAQHANSFAGRSMLGSGRERRSLL